MGKKSYDLHLTRHRYSWTMVIIQACIVLGGSRDLVSQVTSTLYGVISNYKHSIVTPHSNPSYEVQ